jgi:pyruvate kinase
LLVRGDHDGGTVQSLETIQAQLDDLLAVIDRAESEHAQAIALVASEHRAGAVNLVHYTALRQRDIRNLQIDLLDLGATSLATTEADVRAKIVARPQRRGCPLRRVRPLGC